MSDDEEYSKLANNSAGSSSQTPFSDIGQAMGQHMIERTVPLMFGILLAMMIAYSFFRIPAASIGCAGSIG